MSLTRSALCTVLIGILGVLAPSRAVQAALVGSEDLAQLAAGGAARGRVLALVERTDVARELERLGVDPGEAHARIAALSDAELAQIAGQLDRLPAGASTAGAIALGLLIGFAALVITDMLGWTDVFPTVGTYQR